MAFNLPFLSKPKPTTAELEEETERLRAEDGKVDAELSIAQKQEAIKQLKERGLKPSHFGGNWSNIVKWLKTH